MTRSQLRTASLLLVWVAGSACSSETDDTASTTTPTGTSTQTGTSTSTSTCDGVGDCEIDCYPCARSGPCAEQDAACQASIDCINLGNCIGACGTDNLQQCHEQCKALRPVGAQLLDALETCVLCGACYQTCDGAGSPLCS
jgi:hypothetical protein